MFAGPCDDPPSTSVRLYGIDRRLSPRLRATALLGPHVDVVLKAPNTYGQEISCVEGGVTECSRGALSSRERCVRSLSTYLAVFQQTADFSPRDLNGYT